PARKSTLHIETCVGPKAFPVLAPESVSALGADIEPGPVVTGRRTAGPDRGRRLRPEAIVYAQLNEVEGLLDVRIGGKPRRAAEKTCLQASDAHRAVRNVQVIVFALERPIAPQRVLRAEADNRTEAVFTAGCR